MMHPDDDPDSVGAQDQGSPDGNPGPEDAQDEVHGSLAASDDDFRPPDWVCFSTPSVGAIGWLQSLMDGPDNAQHRKNLQAAIEMVRSGVSFTAYQVVADGKLINGDEWRPHMGPFFVPIHVNVPLLSLASGQHWQTNIYSSTNGNWWC